MSKLQSVLGELLQNRRWSTILVGVLAAAKVITDAFGWHVITNQLTNQITNVVAALATIATVFMSHKSPVRVSEGAGDTASSNPVNSTNSDSVSGAIVQSGTDLGATGTVKDDAGAGPAMNSVGDHAVQPEAASDGYARPPGMSN
ncbi:hypothetical protein [Alicyclobacillus dauci]|uniref:Holin n=1 Tax=Alicyclobacillus dauci TaxID=1475485 RepID=A0ABY6Z605_9BACL|nr:hypothetical protein [Alicyclobacillus dauci]WAH38333.1 hypothetical protein NZD86_07600 [Alicyclobacillus dauci]